MSNDSLSSYMFAGNNFMSDEEEEYLAELARQGKQTDFTCNFEQIAPVVRVLETHDLEKTEPQ